MQRLVLIASGDYGRPVPDEVTTALRMEIARHMEAYGFERVEVSEMKIPSPPPEGPAVDRYVGAFGVVPKKRRVRRAKA